MTVIISAETQASITLQPPRATAITLALAPIGTSAALLVQAVADAQAAQSAAELAESGAIAAQGAAEEARDAAESYASSASGSATAASGSASTAAGHAATATTQAGLAATAREGAEAARDAAQAAQGGAESARAAALLAQSQAENAEDGAVAAQGLAETARDLAAGSAITAESFADTNVQMIIRLLDAITLATDMAYQNTRELIPLRDGIGQYDLILEQLAGGMLAALELAGNAARALAGGDVLLGPGSIAAPSLAQAADRDTGFYFPAVATLAAVIAGVEALRIDSNGRLGLGTNTPSGKLDVADSKIRIRDSATPASATAAGNKGEVCWDTSYLYVCINTNTWRRAALSAW